LRHLLEILEQLQHTNIYVYLIIIHFGESVNSQISQIYQEHPSDDTVTVQVVFPGAFQELIHVGASFMEFPGASSEDKMIFRQDVIPITKAEVPRKYCEHMELLRNSTTKKAQVPHAKLLLRNDNDSKHLQESFNRDLKTV